MPWLSAPREFFADDRLDAQARLVLHALCDHADANGCCHPSYETLKRQTGIATDATISKAIKMLEATERVIVTREHRKNNRYRVRRWLHNAIRAATATPWYLVFSD